MFRESAVRAACVLALALTAGLASGCGGPASAGRVSATPVRSAGASGATSSSPTDGSLVPVTPSPSATASITGFSLSPSDQSTLTALYASYRHFPLSDIGGVLLSQTAQVTSTGVRWVLERFEPSATAPESVQLEFQDGADIALFTQAPGAGWRIAGNGSPGGLACTSGVPAAVMELWGYGPFPCPTSQPSATPSS